MHKRCTKSPTTYYGGYSSTFEMVLCMYHSPLAHVLTHVLTTVKTPWYWQPWSAETCRRRFCASMHSFTCSIKIKSLCLDWTYFTW